MATTSIEALDLQTWPIFHAMSRRGLLVDFAKFEDLAQDVEAQIEEQQVMLEMEAPDMNPASPQSVARWLEENKMFTGKRTKGGQVSTDERSLSQLPSHPVIDALLAYRGLTKMLSTFIDPTIDMAKRDPWPPIGGIVHPKWRLTRVRSGRVATEDPNLLAFPSRTELGKKVRSCFVARPGYRMISIDFSQLEPRIVAALSGDPKLLRIFHEDRDLYSEIAAEVGVERQTAKILTLGILYGMGDRRLYEQLMLAGLTKGDPPIPVYDIEACGRLIEEWFESFPSVKLLVNHTVTKARMNGGWAYTVGGRGRLLPGLYVEGRGWPSEKIREEAERQAFNHLIQGTGMEQLKMAMLRVGADCRRGPWPKQEASIHPLLAIHDELIYEVPEADAEFWYDTLVNLVRADFQCPWGDFAVPLKVSASLADDWGSLK